ncbi:MAG: adenosylcobinamide-GDP ribazoletransferase [Deltaproteobacteria bacterium]|nr:adenosylcobinamide-GDP ribazoletransferase [Deltaproteobacteria bacterium]
MKGFVTALQFLTIIRVSKNHEMTGNQLGHSMAWFPLVGLLIGLILAGVRSLLILVLPHSLADVLAIVTLAVVAGALHLDGFADTVDGLAGGKDRERILAIMKDSRIGSFAVTGLALLLLLKVFALVGVPEGIKNRTLIVVPVLGRWSTVQLASFFNYARSGQGTAQDFIRYAGKTEYIISTILTALIVIALFFLKGVMIVLVAAFFTFLFGFYFKRRIGGVTGDIMGASCELNEVMCLLLICGLFT